MVDKIQYEIANSKVDHRFLRITSPKSVYARHQLPHGKWLWQIIISTKLEPGDAVLDFAAGGQHQNAAGEMLRTQIPQDVKPVHAWKNNIEHDQIERRHRSFIQGSFT